MATTVANTTKQTFMLSINPKDKRATKLVEALKVMDFITIEKSPRTSKPTTQPTTPKKRLSRLELSMKEAQEGKVKRFKTVDEMFQSLGI